MCNTNLKQNAMKKLLTKSIPELGLEAFVPDGLETLAGVVDDVAGGGTVAGGEEAADETGEVTADVEVLGVVDTFTFYADAEPAYAVDDDGLTQCEALLHEFLEFGDYQLDVALANATVAAGLFGDFL